MGLRSWLLRRSLSSKTNASRRYSAPGLPHANRRGQKHRIARHALILEGLEERLVPATLNVLNFDTLSGVLSIQAGPNGSTVQVASIAADGISVCIDGHNYSSAAGSSSFDPALASVHAANIRRVSLSGGGTQDALTLSDLTTQGTLAISSDGSVVLSGSIEAEPDLAVRPRPSPSMAWLTPGLSC